MIILAYIVGGIALGCGTGMVILMLLNLEQRERKGSVSKGYLSRSQTGAQGRRRGA